MTDELKYHYALLDLAGNVEDECEMTESEAKKLNDDLWEKDRFLLWVERKVKIISNE